MSDEATLTALPGSSGVAPREGLRRLARGALRFARALSGVGLIDRDARWHLAQLPVLGLTLLAPRRVAVVAAPDDGRRPLVLVHGLGGHRGNFLPLMAWLRARGRRRVYAWGLPRGETIEGLAALLPAYVDEVLAANGLPRDAQVDVVAHSMGGLVARVALEDPAFAARVATLVTLATPHGGSHAARWLATAEHLALRPGSALLQRLARAPAPSTRVVCFWSGSDVLLLPAETARLEGAEAHEVAGSTHYGYLLRPDCWRAVLRALG